MVVTRSSSLSPGGGLPIGYKGAIACAANPNYPAAVGGDMYTVSTAGKIGGASGIAVASGDVIIAKTTTVAGDQATVGANWDILETNIDLANIAITGGTINGTTIGSATSAAAWFTSATANTFIGPLSGNANTATNISAGAIGSLPFQSAASTTRFVAIGSANDVLVVSGSSPVWASSVSSAAVAASANTAAACTGNSLTATTAVNISGGATGSIPIQSAAGNTTLLAIGSAGSILQVSGGSGVWVATPAITLSGGSINSCPIGATTSAAGTFTTLTNAGARIGNVTSVGAATYSCGSAAHILSVTYTATGAVTDLQIMSAGNIAGRILTIKDTGGSASTNTITVTTEGAATIDGSATLLLNSNHQSADLFCDGTNWWVF